MIYEYGEPLCNDTNRGKPKNLEQDLSHCYFSAINPKWTDLGANTGLHGERPVTNCLSHGTAYKVRRRIRSGEWPVRAIDE
jgi:hypothetical protein